MAPLNPQFVGIVSSITCSATFKTYFEGAATANVANALGANWSKYSDNLGYDFSNTGQLAGAVTAFNVVTAGATAVGLIVTAGGNVAYEAANAFSNTVPFLSLVGTVPANPTVRSLGGVSLESFTHNTERIGYLSSMGVKNISLFCNQNSRMYSAETTAWTALATAFNGAKPGTVNPAPVKAMLVNGTNSASDYATTISDIPSGGVIVSADPFFGRTRNGLISALNSFVAINKNRNYVCYPLYNFENKGGTHQPTAGNATLLGPRIEFSIKTLGQMAALALNNATNLGFLKEPIGAPQDL
jgi:hypothetical protein